MSIYKSTEGERYVQELYAKQLRNLGLDFTTRFVDTRFGKTHMIVGGKPDGAPLLIFHGGNTTSPHFLLYHTVLAEQFKIYAPDTIGHPGRSNQRVLSSKNLEYGQWASDIINELGFGQMNCMGASFGGGILLKLMQYAPDKVSKAVLIVPTGIANTSMATIISKLGIPMIKYLLHPDKKNLVRAIIPLAAVESDIDDNNIDMIGTAFKYVKMNAGFPSNAKASSLSMCNAKTILFCGDKDILFSSEKLIKRAKEIIPNLVYSEVMKDCPHMYMLNGDRLLSINEKIISFVTE